VVERRIGDNTMGRDPASALLLNARGESRRHARLVTQARRRNQWVGLFKH
jgi:hypothetical protein